MLLSIIIPVFNVEKYIRTCLNSCILQNIDTKSYEIIIVNDGSTDNSLEIINLYIGEPNVTIISQQNAGLSAARNIGLNKAKGKYVWFVDSDDWIESEILGVIFSSISAKDLDCLRLGYRTVKDDGTLLDNFPSIQDSTSFYQDGMSLLINNIGFSFYAWSFIFKRDFLIKENFSFKEGLIFEDLQLIPLILRKANRVESLAHIVYNYRQRAGSLVNTINEKMLDSILSILDNYDRLIMELTINREQIFFILLLNRIKIFYLVLLANFKNNTKKKEYNQTFRAKYFPIKILDGMPFREKICAVTYNVSSHLFHFLYKIKKHI